MSHKSIARVGAKKLGDFHELSRAPELNYARKRKLVRSPQSQTLFQSLATFANTNVLGWIRQYVLYRLGPRRKFQTYDDPATDSGIYPLSGDEDGTVRVAIAGDWGSGTDEAFNVAAQMQALKPHFTIHLGDVYFVGDPGEVNENFLGVRNPHHDFTPCQWPLGTKGAFALNGNHEMYARGIGYFDLILPAMGMAGGGGQKASFFCLENAHWRVIALDTGYNSIGWPLLEQVFTPDCRLPEPLLAWLRETVKAKDDKRGIVLLSHHQYFSNYDDWYVKPAEQLAEFIDRPVLWLWGHEHRMTVYGKHKFGAGIEAYGRCVGHGGMPVDLPPDAPKHPECPAEFVDGRRYANPEGLNVGFNGFAALTFRGPALAIDYLDVTGALVFSESWTTDAQGGLTRGAA